MQNHRTFIGLSFLILSAGLTPAQGIITTMAGTQFTSCGALGDGGSATSAQLCGAQSAVADASGNIYFYDYGNARIRMVAPNGTIATIAGTGTHGTSGDGGPALSATIGSIAQMAWSNVVVSSSGSGTGSPPTSGAGNLCFGDSMAYKIRCISLDTGIIRGYGNGVPGYAGDGGSVANASFYDLQGAAFDSNGNLYVSDFAENVVRRVDAATGIVTTFAGPGPGYCCAPIGDGGPAAGANIYEPEGLAYSNGALYIADEGNDRVRRVDLSTGIITTFAGNGSPYQSGDGGPATSAGLLPRWLAADASGDLFIDTGVVVREVDTTGTINTVVGTPGIDGYGFDDIPATQTVTAGISGLGFDLVADRLLASDSGSRIRQVFYTSPTTASLAVNPNPAVPGQPITLQATVSPSNVTGSLRFHYGNTVIGTVAVTNGSATFTWTPSGSSSYSLFAVYGGDPTHDLSSSAAITLNVQPGSTTTLLGSSPNPSVQGQPVTFTAAVSPSAATGTITFQNAGTTLGTGTLSGGVATLTTSSLPAGSNSITASYGGSSSYLSSSSVALAQSVKVSTTTALGSSPNPSTFGASVTLTAAVAPTSATGSVQFFNRATLLGSATLSGGTAQLTVVTLPAGTDSLTAAYGGDANNASSASTARVQTVNKTNSTTKLSATPVSQSSSGQTVTFTAMVTPAAATGSVQFLDGSTVIFTAALSDGAAVFATSSLAVGNHSIKAAYLGDANINGSQSTVLSYKIKH